MGLLQPTYRLPLVAPQPQNRDKIVHVLSGLGLVKPAMVRSRA
jgi:hypothetical protein